MDNCASVVVLSTYEVTTYRPGSRKYIGCGSVFVPSSIKEVTNPFAIESHVIMHSITG